MFNFTIDLKFVNENITYLMCKIKKKLTGLTVPNIIAKGIGKLIGTHDF